jgi:putative DNA primase/helicase
MHNPKYEIAIFKRARLITAVEPRKAGHLDEEVLKQITGGDQIMARDIYQKNVVYYPEFKLWLAMNNKPRIIGTDEGIWRRVRFVPFNVSVPDHMKVKEFHKVLFAEEGPGILNRLLEGVRAWRQEGLQISGIDCQSRRVPRGSERHPGFFETYTLSGKRGMHAKAGDLYASYKQWAEAQGEFVMRQNEFAEELQRRSFEKRRVRDDGFHWYGIALKEAPAEAVTDLAFGKSV